MPTTIIVGAGPAGLTTAYELLRLNESSVTLEAEDRVGGLASTFNYRGYSFDYGGHRFFTKVPYIQDIWQEILGEDLLLRDRLSRIHYNEKFFDYPLRPLNALSGLGIWQSFLVVLSYMKARVNPVQEEENFEQWVSNRFGYRLYNIFFKTYTEKVWGMPCHDITADWASQRIKNLSLGKAIRNSLWTRSATNKKEVITSLIDRFLYPRLGPGMMWERCADLLQQNKQTVLTKVRAEGLRHAKKQVNAVIARDDGGKMIEIDGDNFVSTVPLRCLINMLDPLPPDKIVSAANQLRFRDYMVVNLILKDENLFPDNWIYIHSPEVKVGRIQNYKNWSPEMVPDSRYTSLGLEYFLSEKDDEWRWSDEQLIDRAVRECVQIGLVDPQNFVDGRVLRKRFAYPVYDHTYRHNRSIVRRYLESFSNLQTIGRNGLHCYNNQDHSMLTGIYAARNILGADYDVWSVNTERSYHENGIGAKGKVEQRFVPKQI